MNGFEPFKKEQHVQTMTHDKTANLKKLYPVGSQVQITMHDDVRFIGATGEVVDYSNGEDQHAAPMTVIRFTPPVILGLREVTRDAFYDDEFEPIEAEAVREANRKAAELTEDQGAVIGHVRAIEQAMHAICELAQKHESINFLITESYPFKGSLDEVASEVNEWRFAMKNVLEAE